MFFNPTLGALLGTFLILSSIPDAFSYTKYGRTCQDIGCMRDEVCVMAEDPCSLYQRNDCGRYPTCAKARPGEASCASTVCGQNEYCKTENNVPTCVKRTTDLGYESAGVSYVNGQRTNNGKNQEKTFNAGTNTNPYANANAPPEPVDPPGGGYRQVNSGVNSGYPAYPSNGGSNSAGYPPYPSNQGNRQPDLGYPPYPTHNRMPMPGYPGQNNPQYPGQGGYQPGYPQQYPGYQNYPYSNYPNQNRIHQNSATFRRNGASMPSTSLAMLGLISFVLFIANAS